MPRPPLCRGCDVSLPKVLVHAWCVLCSASYCLKCARVHHCCETCEGAACRRGDCCRLVVDGVLRPSYGVRDIDDLAAITRAYPDIRPRGAR